MKVPREKIAAALAVVKVVIAGYGVFASVKNLVDSVREVRTGRDRKVLYVDAGDIPPEKMKDYLAEANRYLRANRESSTTPVVDSVARKRSLRSKSGYAHRTRIRRH